MSAEHNQSPNSAVGPRSRESTSSGDPVDSDAGLANDARKRCVIVTLGDGTAVTLRLVSPEDKPLLIEVFNGMREESRYQRFFTNLPQLPPRLLSYYTELDHSEREAIIAIETSSRRPLGVARYVRLQGDQETAEVAVAVVDDWHRRGIAAAMLSELTRRARQEGIVRLLAVVKATNRAALELFHGAGYRRLESTGLELQLVLELVPIERPPVDRRGL